MTSTLATAPPTPVTGSTRLYRFAAFFAVLTLLHIKWGALVVSSGSGMAFADWPLSRGSLWPPGMNRNELLEHLHRAFGTMVGILAIVLVVWIHRVGERRQTFRAAIWLLLLIVIQGLLGAAGVSYGTFGGVTNPWFATAHGILGQVTLSLQVVIAFMLSPAFGVQKTGESETVGATRKLAAAALAAVFLQLVVGAIFRHTNVQGVPWVHITMALVVAVLILLAAAHASSRFGDDHPGFRRTARWFYLLLVVQLTLGFVAIAVRRFKDPSSVDNLAQILLVSSHVLVGATLFALSTLLVARAWRNLVPGMQGQAAS